MGKSNELDFETAKRLLRIDALNLSEELANHPTNLQRIGERAIRLKSLRDSVKLNMQILEAEIAQEIRSNPPASIKVTEGTISELVLTDERRKVELTQYLDLCKESDLWTSLYEDFKSRGFMLRDLVSLAHNVLTAPDAFVPPDYEQNKVELASRRRPITTNKED